MRDDPAEEMQWFGAWWFWVAFLVLVTALGAAWLAPHFERKATETTRESLSFVTGKQTALRTLKADYDALSVRIATARRIEPDKAGPPAFATSDEEINALVAQQRGILRFMRQEAALIPKDVPLDIQEFLRGQP